MSDIGAIAQAAYQKLRAGDAAGAERLLAPAIAAEPNHASALSLMGIIQQTQGRLDEAARTMRAALQLAPGNAQYHSNLGVVLQAQGQFDEGLRCFRAALALDPKLQGARANIVRTLMAAGAEAEAADEARVLAQTDGSPQAWDFCAAAERAAGRFQAALASSDEALCLALRTEFRPGRALALEQLGRNAEALAEWQNLARGGAASPELAVHLARALAHAGKAGDADAVLAQAAQQWPSHVTVQGQLARLRWMQGARADFTATIEGALRERPTDFALRVEATVLLSQSGRLERAETLLREGLASAPDNPALLKALAAALGEQGRAAEALALIEPHPSPSLRAERPALLLRLGRAREALSELRAMPRRADGGQQLVALEALAMRLLGDPGYHRLYDYDRFVHTYDVVPPHGTTIEFNTALARSLRALHADAQHPLDQTLRNGTQTGRDLRHVDDPVIQAFLAALDAPIRAYIAALSPDDPLGVRRREKYRLAGAWSVLLRPGGFHVNHVHDHGWISSAYYIELPPADSDTQAGWLKFGESPWPLSGCGAEKVIQPRVGMLALFPSYMLHGTVPFSSGERLTAAFDVVPV